MGIPVWATAMDFYTVLSSNTFRYAIFPAAAVFAGVYVKYETRKQRFRREDFAVGPQLMLSACFMLTGVAISKALVLNTTKQKLASVTPDNFSTTEQLHANALQLSRELNATLLMLLCVGFLLWGICSLVRSWGWKTRTQLRPWLGIMLPLVFGFLTLIAVMTQVGQ